MPIPFLAQEFSNFGDYLLVFNTYIRGVDQNRCHRGYTITMLTL